MGTLGTFAWTCEDLVASVASGFSRRGLGALGFAETFRNFGPGRSTPLTAAASGSKASPNIPGGRHNVLAYGPPTVERRLKNKTSSMCRRLPE